MASLIYNSESSHPQRIKTRVSSARVKLRSMTKEKWERLNFKLSENELAYDKTSRRLKIGDGVTLWNDLPYLILDVGGNFQGIMTLAEFNLFYAAYQQFKDAEQLKYDNLLAGDLNLNGKIVTLENKVKTLEEATPQAVDLTGYISAAVFAQYQTAQNTLNNNQNNRLDAVEAVNETQTQINTDHDARITDLENRPIGGEVDTSNWVTSTAFNTYKTQNDATNTTQGQSISTLQTDLANAIARILALENGAGSGGSTGGNNNGGGGIMATALSVGNIYEKMIVSQADRDATFEFDHGLSSVLMVLVMCERLAVSTIGQGATGAMNTAAVGDRHEWAASNLPPFRKWNGTKVFVQFGNTFPIDAQYVKYKLIPIGIA